MKEFTFNSKDNLCKLPEEWRLLELLRQYKYANYLANLNTNSQSLRDISKNIEEKIIY